MRRKLTLATVVGARPQFIKCAPFSRLWRARHREILIHTGQHYSPGMSDVFFRELKIPKPDYHLGIGRGSHGEQTGRMLRQLDPLLDRLNPDGVLVYGDTNSTLAGALAAAKLKIPVFHVEAGMRSYRKDMPEEINRVLTDHVSDLLFVPTANAVHNLRKENIRKDVYQVGDIMLDAFRYFEKLTTRKSFRSPLRPPYALATHRHSSKSLSHSRHTPYDSPSGKNAERFSIQSQGLAAEGDRTHIAIAHQCRTCSAIPSPCFVDIRTDGLEWRSYPIS